MKTSTTNFFCCGVIAIVICVCSISCRNNEDSAQDFSKDISLRKVPAFDPPVFDYGNVLQGERIMHNFCLVNRTTNEFWVTGIQTSCSCTAAQMGGLMGKILLPQGEIVIPVTFETGTRDGYNKSSVYVSLLAKNGEKYLTQCFLQGEIIPDFTFEPKSLSFGLLKPGQTATNTVTFHPGNLKNIKLSEIQTMNPAFQVLDQRSASVSLTNTNLSIVISVVVQAPNVRSKLELGSLLRVATSSERFPLVDIPLTGQIIPDELVAPENLVFSSGNSQGVSRLVALTVNPSCVVRISTKTTDGRSEFLNRETAQFSQDWALRHDIEVTNSKLCSVKQLDVELLVQHEAGRNETRSVSVKIIRLDEKERMKND